QSNLLPIGQRPINWSSMRLFDYIRRNEPLPSKEFPQLLAIGLLIPQPFRAGLDALRDAVCHIRACCLGHRFRAEPTDGWHFDFVTCGKLDFQSTLCSQLSLLSRGAALKC